MVDIALPNVDTGIGAIANLLKDGFDKIWPDPAAAAAAKFQIAQLDAQLAQGQMAINQVEAASNNFFVAGWRPFIGWVCGMAFTYHFILQPSIVFFFAAHYQQKIDMPAFDMSTLTTVLFGILGLGVTQAVQKMGEKGHLPWQQ